jgi:hypothetical protein
MTEFTPWPKIARLNKNITVTEKIDGTNAAIQIEDFGTALFKGSPTLAGKGDIGAWQVDDRDYTVAAQSRSRLLALGQDNFGFALWVATHAEELIRTLGPGLHFGEWWGSGIQRGYDQPKGLKHFSLFNTHKHRDVNLEFEDGSRVRPVPVIAHYGRFSSDTVDLALDTLREEGSLAAPGFMRPEGVVVFHEAARTYFKAFVENDDIPKGDS